MRPPPEYTWDNTNPALTNFNCVLHMNGATPYNAFGDVAQQNLIDFVKAGGGYISTGWSGYEAQSFAPAMKELALHGSGSGGAFGNAAYTKVAAQAAHPINLGLADTFGVTWSDYHEDFFAGFFSFAQDPAIAILNLPSGIPAVSVRQLGTGKVVRFGIVTNWNSFNAFDANTLKVFVNAAAWACR